MQAITHYHRYVISRGAYIYQEEKERRENLKQAHISEFLGQRRSIPLKQKNTALKKLCNYENT